MSVMRKVKVNIDLDLMKEIATSMGYKVEEIFQPSKDRSLVIRKGYRQIAFAEENGEINAIYDNMDTAEYATLMGSYIEKAVEEKSGGSFETLYRDETSDKLKIFLRRR